MASSKVQCPRCSKQYTNKPALQGRKVSCKCGQVFRMPGAKTDTAPAQSPRPVPTPATPVPADPPTPAAVAPVATAHPAPSTVQVACPTCQQTHSVSSALAGQPFNCPCGSPFLVPTPTAPPSAPLASAPVAPSPQPMPVASPAQPVASNSYWNRNVAIAQPKPRKIVKKKLVVEPPKRRRQFDVNEGIGNVIVGSIFLLAGGAITIGTYLAAKQGGTYWIAYGPVIYGVYMLFTGLGKMANGS